jgi:hypothetical protein
MFKVKRFIIFDRKMGGSIKVVKNGKMEQKYQHLVNEEALSLRLLSFWQIICLIIETI